MFVTELDRPAYLVVEKRGFDDKEISLTRAQHEVIRKLTDDTLKLQLWLREVYAAGDNSFRVVAPQWLVNQAAELERAKPATEVASSKKLPHLPDRSASNLNTNL